MVMNSHLQQDTELSGSQVNPIAGFCPFQVRITFLKLTTAPKPPSEVAVHVLAVTATVRTFLMLLPCPVGTSGYYSAPRASQWPVSCTVTEDQPPPR